MIKDFEDYLKDIHAENHSDGILDDDLADHFDDWTANDLMVDELITYADKYAKIRFLEGQMDGLKQGKQIVQNVFHPCKTCDGTYKVTYNAGHDDEYTTACPDCQSGEVADMDDSSDIN